MEEVEIRCYICSKKFKVRFHLKDLNAWLGGMLVQDAFPYLTANERELLISNICGECFDNLGA